MTTIVFDGNLLVADTLCCWGNIKEDRIATKLAYSKGRYFAVAGLDGLLATLIRWFEAGADPRAIPQLDGNARASGWTLVVVNAATGDSTYYDNDQPHGSPTTKKWAIGSGKQFALGAMQVGASALDAVSAARDLDTTTGGPLQWFNVATPVKRGKQPTLYCSDASYNSKERV